ncbi:MAG: membrane protein insertase YidC [Pseudomonadota bacterium]|nr:membrane protein insertase YidC [Pseudomonadota bacterium]
MNAVRYLLFGALAVVAYLLILAWNRDYTPGVADAPAPAETTAPQNSDLPQPANAATSADLLTTTPDAPPTAATDQPTAAVSSTRAIRVTTDVLHVAIDPVGGDLVYAALPQYPETLDRPDAPFVVLERDGRTFHIAQSGLVGPQGPDANASGRPLYSASATDYELAPGQEELVVPLAYTSPEGVYIEKRFRFRRDSHLVSVEYSIHNQGNTPWEANLFAQLKRDMSPDPAAQNAGFGVSTYLGPALYTPDEKYKKVDFKDVRKTPLNQRIEGGWIAMVQHYFVAAWIPNPAHTYLYQMRPTSDDRYTIVGFTGPRLEVAPQATATASAQLYIGPKVQDRLAPISPGLELTIDYGWLWFIAQPLFWLLDFIHGIVGNWGVAIVLLTLLVKAAFFQLSATSYRSMAKMRQLQPKMMELRDRHGSDRQKLSQATMELYRKEKVNPLGGCLPILVQMPVFIALYWTLMESVELRHASFLWIRDLSALDPYFILPILMGVSMYVQQHLNPAPPDPTQARIMKLMPIAMTVFFLWFPAGLVLYWVVNNLLSIAQQWYITRQIERAAA